MKYGIAMFPTDYAIQADALARELEARGFESLWLPEHTHIPASRRSPWPGGPNLPKEYWNTYDPFVALTVAAAQPPPAARPIPRPRSNAAFIAPKLPSSSLAPRRANPSLSPLAEGGQRQRGCDR